MVSILSYPFLLLFGPFLMAKVYRVVINISGYVTALIARMSPSQISDCQVLICYMAGPKASYNNNQVLILYKVGSEVSF